MIGAEKSEMKLTVLDLTGFSARTAERALNLFPAQRIAEIARLKKGSDRLRSIAAEAAVRLEIMQTLRVPREAIHILRGEKGKPRLDGAPSFFFNVSHSGGCAVCAFDARPVGVDVEEVRPARSRAAARCFSAEERAAIARAADPLLAFFCVWTAKESVIKQRGSSLAADLRSLNVCDLSLGGSPLSCTVSTYLWKRGTSRLLPAAKPDGANDILSLCPEQTAAPALSAADKPDNADYILSLCTEQTAAPELSFSSAEEIARTFSDL